MGVTIPNGLTFSCGRRNMAVWHEGLYKTMTNSTAKVAIIGFGTIGSGVARLLLEHQDRISRQAGRKVELVRIVDAGH